MWGTLPRCAGSVQSVGPPVPVPCELKQGRPDDHAHEGRVNQYSDCEGEAQHLDHDKISQRECPKDSNHDGSGAGDQTGGTGEGFDDGGALREASPAFFEDSRDEEDLVVHAETKDDGKDEDRNDGEDCPERGSVMEQRASVAILKDEYECAECGTDREQIKGDRFHSREQGSQADQERGQ